MQAWIHWRDGKPLELLDPILGDFFSRDEVTRCIHIGLLCVQEDPAERPTMETIVLTLNTGSAHCNHLNSHGLINLHGSQCHVLLMNRPLLNYTLDN